MILVILHGLAHCYVWGIMSNAEVAGSRVDLDGSFVQKDKWAWKVRGLKGIGITI